MHGEMAVMNRKGDTKIIWDTENEHEVENARRTFNELRKAGHMAFAVRGNGAKGDQITEFDPEAEKLIMAPAMAGG